MDRKRTNPTAEDSSLTALWRSSPLAAGNAADLENLYEQFLSDPAAVAPAWRRYFEALPRVDGVTQDIPHSAIRDEFRRLAHQTRPAAAPRPSQAAEPIESAHKQVKVLQLINAYRFRAHQIA